MHATDTPAPAAPRIASSLVRSAAAAAFLAALTACGGGGGDSSPAPISPAPTPAPVPLPPPPAPTPPAPPPVASVNNSTVGTARYSQSVLLTVSGSNLDQGLTVASPGCRAGTIQRSTTAPNVSSAGTAYYTCTVSEVGAQQFSVTRSSDGTALRTQAFTVEVPQVTLVMDRGTGTSPATLVLTLTPQQTPVTVTNFLDYVNSGFYVGTVFHRNSPGFVLQGGGFTGPLMAGGPAPTPKATRPPIVLEVGRGLSNLRYTVAMARTNDVNSATSQFFINLVDNVFLDSSGGGYAVFGSITTGTDRVQTYANSTDCFAWAALLPAGDCLPTPNITITSAIQTR